MDLEQNFWTDKFISIVTAAVWVFVTLIWAFLGLFVWVPLVARSTFLMSAAIPLEAITGKKGYADSASRFLRSSIEIYPKGFQIITKSIYTRRPGNGHWDFKDDWKIVFREFLWAAIFWLILDLIVDLIFGLDIF